jgi:hypothetical protein
VLWEVTEIALRLKILKLEMDVLINLKHVDVFYKNMCG